MVKSWREKLEEQSKKLPRIVVIPKNGKEIWKRKKPPGVKDFEKYLIKL